jgi:hypothetical protein
MGAPPLLPGLIDASDRRQYFFPFVFLQAAAGSVGDGHFNQAGAFERMKPLAWSLSRTDSGSTDNRP